MTTITYPKLTKKDAAGVPRFYWATVTHGEYTTYSQKTRSGNILSSSPTTPRAQSIRSPHEQACFEVEAIYKKRERLGWTPTTKKRKERGEAPGRWYAPMLAHKYPHLKPHFPCYAQPKLDGVRCIITREGLWTRKNMEITSVPHLRREAVAYLESFGDNMFSLDGEIYLHGTDLHTISGLCRRKEPSVESYQLQLHIFDCEENYGSPFETRHRRLKPPTRWPSLQLVETHRCEDEEDLDFLHARWVRRGYEGSIYRDRNARYLHKRTKALLKRKDFLEREFTVIGVREGNGAWRGCAKAIDYVDDNGETFESGIRGDQHYLRQVLKDKHKIIGALGTVRYFSLTPKRGVPYLPVTVNLGRWDLGDTLAARYARIKRLLGKQEADRLTIPF